MKKKVVANSKICMKDMGTGEEETCVLANPEEVNVGDNEISIASPIGVALIDRSEGEIVEVQVPAGTRKIKIIKVFPKGKEQT